MQEVLCPKCHSNQIAAGKKGFNNVIGGIGMLSGDAMKGLAMGTLGSNKVIITCLQCGHQFQPGQGAVRTVKETGEQKQEEQSQQEYIIEPQKVNENDKVAKTITAVIFIIFLIVLLFIMRGCFVYSEVSG